MSDEIVVPADKASLLTGYWEQLQALAGQRMMNTPLEQSPVDNFDQEIEEE